MNLPEFSKQKVQQVITNTAPGTHDRSEGFPPPTAQGMRDFIVTVGETTANECNEARQMVRIIDATFESRMLGMSSWTVRNRAEISARTAAGSTRTRPTRT
jgi:hypothetical protein